MLVPASPVHPARRRARAGLLLLLARCVACLALAPGSRAAGVTLQQLGQINQTTSSSDPSGSVAFRGGAYQAVNDGVHGSELWKSDGTRGGTTLVKDINPGDGGASPQGLTVMGDTLYFSANDGVDGYELWTSDGTDAGTTLVADVDPGPGYSYPAVLPSSTPGAVRFLASDGQHGRETWRLGSADDASPPVVTTPTETPTTPTTTVPGPPAPTPPTPPTTGPGTPTATSGARVGSVGGRIVIRDSKGRVLPLSAGNVIPQGTTIDATRGRIVLLVPDGAGRTTAVRVRGGQFHYGRVTTRVPAGRSTARATVTRLTLRGGRRVTCAAGRTVLRRLTVTTSGSGWVQVVGGKASGLTRSATSTTTDRCGTTTVSVAKGAVRVTDAKRRRTTLVRRGHRYRTAAR